MSALEKLIEQDLLVRDSETYPNFPELVKKAAAELEQLQKDLGNAWQVITDYSLYHADSYDKIPEQAAGMAWLMAYENETETPDQLAHLRAENAQLARAAAEAMVTADRANVQLRAENAEMLEAIKSALVDLETPDEVDLWTARAFRTLAAILAKHTEEPK